MKSRLIYISIVIFSISCGNPESAVKQGYGASTVLPKKVVVGSEEISSEKVEISKDTISPKKTISESIITTATVLSVKEELIMPGDYLTTAMTVKTASNDTLAFLDMYGFEKLVNQEISIEYKMTPGSKLLVCFNCTSYSERIELYDITSFPSVVEFESLRLKEYVQDPYIEPASTFIMLKPDGSLEEYYSNDNDLISDSTKMTSAFHSYGTIIKLHPELENREELEKLLE